MQRNKLVQKVNGRKRLKLGAKRFIISYLRGELQKKVKQIEIKDEYRPRKLRGTEFKEHL